MTSEELVARDLRAQGYEEALLPTPSSQPRCGFTLRIQRISACRWCRLGTETLPERGAKEIPFGQIFQTTSAFSGTLSVGQGWSGST